MESEKVCERCKHGDKCSREFVTVNKEDGEKKYYCVGFEEEG